MGTVLIGRPSEAESIMHTRFDYFCEAAAAAAATAIPPEIENKLFPVRDVSECIKLRVRLRATAESFSHKHTHSLFLSHT